MTWIFQGNPERFDIDSYLSSYPNRIYWYTNRYINDISIGDSVFIWRSGINAGAVAAGSVVELPTPAQSVKFPEALGGELWGTDEERPDELKTGIELSDVRLTLEERMVSRKQAKEDPALSSSTIITIPNGTVFRLECDALASLERLWGYSLANISHAGATEGQRQLRAHYFRERSSLLRHEKLQLFRNEHGRLYCEVCKFEAPTFLPKPFTDKAFEVHHRTPLSSAPEPVQTKLDDLAVLCANCHRSVHANAHVAENYSELAKLYKT